MRQILMVTYDLKGPSADYSGLYDLLKGQTNWWHYLKSTWLVVTDLDPSEFTDQILKFTKDGDRFLVTSLTEETDRSGWLPKKAWKWIENRLGELSS